MAPTALAPPVTQENELLLRLLQGQLRKTSRAAHTKEEEEEEEEEEAASATDSLGGRRNIRTKDLRPERGRERGVEGGARMRQVERERGGDFDLVFFFSTGHKKGGRRHSGSVSSLQERQ